MRALRHGNLTFFYPAALVCACPQENHTKIDAHKICVCAPCAMETLIVYTLTALVYACPKENQTHFDGHNMCILHTMRHGNLIFL